MRGGGLSIYCAMETNCFIFFSTKENSNVPGVNQSFAHI